MDCAINNIVIWLGITRTLIGFEGIILRRLRACKNKAKSPIINNLRRLERVFRCTRPRNLHQDARGNWMNQNKLTGSEMLAA